MDKLPDTIEGCYHAIKPLLKTIVDLSNFSLSPSKNLQQKRSNQQYSGKKTGGQPGHKGYYRELLPNVQVNFIESCSLPENCEYGGNIKSSAEHVCH